MLSYVLVPTSSENYCRFNPLTYAIVFVSGDGKSPASRGPQSTSLGGLISCSLCLRASHLDLPPIALQSFLSSSRVGSQVPMMLGQADFPCSQT